MKEVKKVFCIQGEKESAEALAQRIKKDLKVDAVAPRPFEEFEF